MNYNDFRQNLKSTIDTLVSDHERIIITRKNGDNVVMVSYGDYVAIEEATYLLKSPKNAKRLRD